MSLPRSFASLAAVLVATVALVALAAGCGSDESREPVATDEVTMPRGRPAVAVTHLQPEGRLT